MSSADSRPSFVPSETTEKDTRAVLGLLLATIMWGCGFTWAKAAGEAVNRAAGPGQGGALGPIFILAWRFVLASLVLFLLIPATRRGWSLRSARRIGGVGLILAGSIIIQHLGLDWTSEAVSAFLTNLTVVFVPVIVLVTTGRRPSLIVWCGIALAVIGVWLITGAQPTGFGRGELLGVGCALGFSIYILTVNAVAKTEDVWRMTAGQFLVTAIVCTLVAACSPGGADALEPHKLAAIMKLPAVWQHVVLLTGFTTVGAFTLLNRFQPKLEPTRAALIYLIEPICAATYAYVAIGRPMTKRAIAGAALILLANVVVEVIAVRSRGRKIMLRSTEY